MSAAVTAPPPSAIDRGALGQAVEGAIVLTRRRIDQVLVAAGLVVAVVLAAASGLLMWGSNFSKEYVRDELTAQKVFFPDAAALKAEGRTDLLGYAGRQVTSGDDAQAYAGYIDHHLARIANNQTYAELGAIERAAKAEVVAATTAKQPADQITALQTKASAITGQRDTLFKGETLRGLLLSTYAWWTIGTVAWVAAIVSAIAAIAMLLLTVMGFIHLRRSR